VGPLEGALWLEDSKGLQHARQKCGVTPRTDEEGALLLIAGAVLDEAEGDVQRAADEYAEAAELLEKRLGMPTRRMPCRERVVA
jgi:hypothetical protein